MKISLIPFFTASLFILSAGSTIARPIIIHSIYIDDDDLDRYVQRLRTDQLGDRKETAFMSAGAEFLSGYNYYEKQSYDMASMYFENTINKDPNNPYAYYLLGISLIKQNDKYKTQKAQEYLAKAYQLNASLKQRYQADVPVSEKPSSSSVTGYNDLNSYIEHLKYSKANNQEDTRFMTPGNYILSGIEYFEEGTYGSAQTRFETAIKADPNNAYCNYLLGISVLAQGNKAGQAYLDKSIQLAPALKSRYANDLATAKASHQKYTNKIEGKSTNQPVVVEKKGGALTFGNYTCHQTIYNGASSAGQSFTHQYKGYFELKSNGTYKWLDNGQTGKYQYNSATGKITWLSGKLATMKIASSLFMRGEKTAQITLTIKGSYIWECGCDKK